MAIQHKCFISYHRNDKAAVEDFVRTFDQDREVFVSRAVGVEQAIISSKKPKYVMQRIRELYLTDSTVTIVMIGKCTWARRFVDWEIASTLQNDRKNKRSGLFGIRLPEAPVSPTLPPRFKDNCYEGRKYGRLYRYPTSAHYLATWIEDAFQARDNRGHLADNRRSLAMHNLSCF